MADLKILGPVELRREDGQLEHSFLAGPKRLALLAYLTLDRPRGIKRRDQILPLLWPQKGQKSARNSLSNLLYQIRSALGKEFIITRGTEEIGINYDKLSCDAISFEENLDKGEPENALKIYRGELLKGLHIPGTSPEFDQWLERERERYRKIYGEILEQLANKAENEGDLKKAAELWDLRAQTDPYDTNAVRRTVELLTQTGSKGEALKKAEEHARFMYQELGAGKKEILNNLLGNIDDLTSAVKITSTGNAGPLRNIDPKSVAILPLEELGNDEQISTFASGLHNDMLTRLSGVADLSVISRTSVLQYRNSDKSIREIASEIGAGSIVEGSVQIIDGRVRLNIQLIRVKDDNHIWAEIYDRELTAQHLFDIQSELALKITNSLKANLTPGEKKRVEQWAPTNDLEAHRLYTYGKKHLDQRTEKGMNRAAEYFQRAVDQDPNYALAWAGLADTMALQFDYGYKAAEISLSKAEDALIRALEIDPNLAEAYASRGLLYSNRHQGSAAIRELNRAVELQPSYAEAHNWLSWNYQLLGEAGKAFESAKTAVNLNPLSPEAVSNLSASLLYNGYPQKALDEALRGIELQPEWNTLTFYQALALMELNRVSEAKSKLKNLSVPWAGNGPLATLALCHLLLGEKDEAGRIESILKEKGDVFALGLIRAATGEYDRSIQHFLQIEEWDDWEALSIHHIYPGIMQPLKADPRFDDILKKVNQSRGLE